MGVEGGEGVMVKSDWSTVFLTGRTSGNIFIDTQVKIKTRVYSLFSV